MFIGANIFGCRDTALITVTVNQKPTVTITGNQTICQGQSVTLTTTGGGTYAWTPGGQTTASITVTPSVSTTYTCVVTGTNGCTGTNSTIVTVNPKPTVTITGNQTVCQGLSTTLTASGGGTYVWLPSGQTTASITVTPSVSITYTLITTGANGCKDTTLVSVKVISCGCPDSINIVKNGSFESGTPSGTDESIGLATNWGRIWQAPYGQSTADYWNTGAQNPFNGIGLTTPTPASQSKFAGFWLHNTTDLSWREGILSSAFTTPIAQNSGIYDLSLKVACLENSIAGARLSIFGVPTGAVSTLAVGNPLTGNTPLNPNLFNPSAVLLATYPIPTGCTAAFTTIPLQFNANILPSQGIERIFLTRTDGVSGKAYVAIDDICLKRADTCVCGTYSGMNYRPSQGAPNAFVTCGDTLAAPCIAGFNWTMGGNFQCAGTDTCRPTGNISWVLRGVTSGILTSGTTNSVIGISIPSTTFSSAGLYTLTLTAICGTDTCRCIFKLRSAGCTPVDNCVNQACTGSFTWQQLRNDLFVKDMVVYNGKLVVAGSFTVGGFNNIAQWDGTTWTALGAGLNNNVEALAIHNGKLYAGGSFTSPGNRIAVWDGSTWSALGSGINGGVNSLVSYGTSLVAGGSFTIAGGISANNIASWDGVSTWSNFNIGMNGSVTALGTYNGNLVAGGLFTSAGSAIANKIALWNGTAWSVMGTGITSYSNTPNESVRAILQMGTDLIVAGRFADAGGVGNTQSIAKWNGTAWNPIATGLVGVINTGFEGIYDLKLHVGTLYVGGRFTQIGGIPINAVARWSTNWQTTNATDQLVRALESYATTGSTACQPYSAGEIFVNRYTCTTPTNEVNQLNFRIVPNPNDGNFTIELSEAAKKQTTYRITDLLGRIVLEKDIKTGIVQQNVLTNSLSNGLYFLQVLEEGKIVKEQKFVKQ
jgi:hypothetical protein